jgi:hypothetical protein
VEVPSLPHLDYGPAATDIRQVFAVNGTYELPFGKDKAFLANTGKVTQRLVSGWSVTTITNLLTGFPFSPQLGYNPTGSGDSRNPVRPNVNPNFTGPLYNRANTAQKVAQYFNPNAFSEPLSTLNAASTITGGTVGNAGRDSLTGPGFADWDVSLLKTTQITERVRLQFRAEFFNVLNHTNLQLPNEIAYASAPMLVGGVYTPSAPSATAGNITATANSSRQIQLAAKIFF